MRSKHVLLMVCLAMTAPMASDVSAETTTYSCYYETATIVGTPGDDVLIGREDTADVIVGLGGNDKIRGLPDFEDRTLLTAPGDRLCGGPGDDNIRGGTGEDRIQGGRGNDGIEGNDGYDVILQGGLGHDSVTDCDAETAGSRNLEGGPGDDFLCVDSDRARMSGNGGDDVLIDLKCSQEARMNGGPGDDHFESYTDGYSGEECGTFGPPDNLVGGLGLDDAIVSPNDRTTEIETVEVRDYVERGA